jgi:hypothetical protein
MFSPLLEISHFLGHFLGTITQELHRKFIVILGVKDTFYSSIKHNTLTPYHGRMPSRKNPETSRLLNLLHRWHTSHRLSRLVSLPADSGRICSISRGMPVILSELRQYSHRWPTSSRTCCWSASGTYDAITEQLQVQPE